MTKIKSFSQFILEEVSGTEIPNGPGGSFGPAFGETRLQNKTINTKHTTPMRVDGFKNDNSKNSLTNDIFFDDEYLEIYNNYLKSGGSESNLGIDKEENISIMMDYLQGI